MFSRDRSRPQPRVDPEVVLPPLLLLALAILCAVIGLLGGWDAMFRLAYVLFAFVALGFVWSRLGVYALALSRTSPASGTQVGRQVPESVELRLRIPFWLPWAEVRDVSPLNDSGLERVVAPGWRRRLSWSSQAVMPHRGRVPLGPTLVAVSDPFGLFRAERNVPANSSLLVLPEIESLPPRSAWSAQMEGVDTAQHRAAQTDVTQTVREYVPGDPLRHMHWASTARLGRPMVREFEPELARDVWVVLDLHRAHHVGRGRESSEEYAVRAAASLVAHYFDLGSPVGLLSQGIVLPPSLSEPHLRRALEWLAEARPQKTPTLGALLQARAAALAAARTVVLVTPAPDAGWRRETFDLLHAGVALEVVYLDGASFIPRAAGREETPVPALPAPVFVLRRGQRLRDALTAGGHVPLAPAPGQEGALAS